MAVNCYVHLAHISALQNLAFVGESMIYSLVISPNRNNNPTSTTKIAGSSIDSYPYTLTNLEHASATIDPLAYRASISI